MTVALETVVKQLGDSGIVAAGKLEQFVPPKAYPTSAEELVRELVKQNHLTRFQAAQVAAGRAKSLLLGEYTILDKIAAGGMGQVFKALHRRMDRTVAIKTLPPAMTKDAPAVARFEREVRAAAKLSHPNIVTAYDAGHANGVHFFVMEYVEGSDLSALVKKNGPFSVAKATNYILQAARGLEFAHDEGIVHRDIKPANLLVDKKGVVKILDMGLARIASEADAATQAELTGTGAIMGTVDYMAPEQALSTKYADARADIYSLGCSLYYLLTGQATYDGDTLMSKLLAHRDKPIPALHTMFPEVPEEVEAVFVKMVAKNAEDRYQSMTEVIYALEKCRTSAVQTVNFQHSFDTSADVNPTISFSGISSAQQMSLEPEKAARPQVGKDRRKLVLRGGGIFGMLFLLAALMVKIKTPDGMLIVTVNEPDAEVQVLSEEGTVEITRKGEKGPLTIAVDPGKHRLKVSKDGFTVFTEAFEIENGGRTAITAKLEAVRLPLSETADLDRTAAEWVLSIGGTIETEAGEFTDAAKLPQEPFHIVAITLNDNQQVSDDSLKRLQGLKNLKVLRLQSTKVTDSGLEYLKGLTNLGSLELSYTKVSDAGLEHLKGLTNLTYLGIATTQVTDAGLKHLKGLTNLTNLTLANNPQVSDIGVENLKGLTKLTRFAISGTTVTDSGLQLLLKELTNLTEFGVARTNVTDEGMIYIKGLSNLTNLDLQSSQIGDAGLQHLSGLTNLTNLNISNSKVTDAGLKHIKKLKRLDGLDLRRTIVTPQGVADLQKALPKCKIEWDDPNQPTFTKPASNINDPAFQQWMKDVAEMSAEEQVKAVSKKLVELNSGFDGTMTNWDGQGQPNIQNGMVTQIEFVTDNVTDISPVRALVGLQTLVCRGSGQGKGRLTDITPLKDMSIKHIYLDVMNRLDIEALRSLKKLETINYKPVAEFWKEVEGN